MTKISQIEQIAHLPGDILLSLARNDSAPREMRKAAVELMLDNGFRQASHPELAMLVLDIKHEREAKNEVKAQVEAAVEHEIYSVEVPALRASFTTDSMMREEIHNPEGLGDDALTGPEVGSSPNRTQNKADKVSKTGPASEAPSLFKEPLVNHGAD